MKSQRKNKFILHLFFLLLLGNSLIAFPNMQVQAATAKTYKVKINRVHKGELVKKKSGWYLQSKTYKITTRAAEKRVVKLTILSKSGLNSGYYYFDSKGKLDRRNKFHYLNTKVDGVRFNGMYYFGRSGGRLLQTQKPQMGHESMGTDMCLVKWDEDMKTAGTMVLSDEKWTNCIGPENNR